MPLRFEADFGAAGIDFNPYIDEVFAELTSTFLTMPRGEGFLDYPTFESGYEALKKATGGFTTITADLLIKTVYATPVTFVVIRTILGFTPPEWAYVTTERGGIEVAQGAARTLDRKMRLAGLTPHIDKGSVTDVRIKAMVAVAVSLLEEGAGEIDNTVIVHRLDKVDTAKGIRSLRPVADLGVPYPVLLYERFLGRPFATHRDAVSELVGDVVESAVESVLAKGGVSNRKTKRAERINGFDQAPDFIVPSEFNPAVIIEAKLTEDDGTARDKVARVQNLRAIRDREGKNYEIVACIAGRGFKVRREDIRRLLEATDGKVFTLETVDRLLECTRIRDFVTRI
ncbi:hypothetical protein [Bradyrhizobium erythrophlei]|uniref:Uncharacterized protein n=1 Tax=Bradyrhizobium erythrophlei TaxID=1437360 RepID=A0A1H4P1T2_9BRAD|nr:hypothetical protein [Bradyrhizobium erythrophlei]SEC01118.1 hypothetical protein SAMN05444164_0791 [Bradyrhizobium erythrophlei]